MNEASAELQNIVQLLQELHGDMSQVLSALHGATKDFYTVGEIAERTGRSSYTVRRWIGEGRLHAERVVGTGPRGRLLIPRSEVAKLV